MRMRLGVAALVCGGAICALAAQAAETTTYTYDSLGRLIATAKSGGPRNGETTSTAFDPAGNRAGQAVNAQAPAASTGATFTISGGTTVNEGAGTFVQVFRTGGIASTVSVNYATANGSAVAPSDYTSASGTLTFAPYETQRAFPLSTIADSVAEPAESFTVALSSPSAGSTIGTGSATININASSGPPAPNNPPSAVATSVSVGVCLYTTKVITATDSDGDYPITIVAGSNPGFAEVSPTGGAGGLELGVSGYTVGSGPVSYTIQDSRGAQATGTINVTVTNGSGCSRQAGGN